MKLVVAWCSYAAARHAVMNWHYSKRMPMPPLARVGVWEDDTFIGCVLFGRGANPQLGMPFGLSNTECCELVRIALTEHQTPVTRILRFAMKLVREANPKLRLVVSYADTREGHHGGVYQGANWIYTGVSSSSVEYLHQGRWKHSREILGGAFGGDKLVPDHRLLPSRRAPGKHRYVMPFDSSLMPLLKSMQQPYPKRAAPVVATAAVSGSTADELGQHARTEVLADRGQ